MVYAVVASCKSMVVAKLVIAVWLCMRLFLGVCSRHVDRDYESSN